MSANIKIAAGALATLALVAAAYFLGRQQGQSVAPAAAPLASAPAVTAAAPNHPASAGAMPVSDTEGRVGAPAAGNERFSHFRVGNKNVKSSFVDGAVVWGGSSGGVVRVLGPGARHGLDQARAPARLLAARVVRASAARRP